MKWSILFFLAGFFLLACTTRPVTPSRASRRAIDTIYQQKVLALQPHLDSMCTLLQDSIYTLAIDSILTERREEMNELVK
jgi:hypothetical protein